MKKQIFSIISALGLLTGMTAFADGVGLDLLDGGLSILDSLFLIAMGVTIIGVVLICIAFLKPEKQKPEPEKPEEEFSVFNEVKAEAEKKEFSVFDTVEEPKTLSPQESTPKEDEKTQVLEEEPADEEPQEEVKEEVQEEVEEEVEEEVQEEVEEEPTRKLSLTGVNNEEVKIIPLKAQVLIGRKGSCDVVISDSAISGEHCLLITEDEKVSVEDKQSTNGTFVNGERITEKTEIKKGDILALGHMKFRVGL